MTAHKSTLCRCDGSKTLVEIWVKGQRISRDQAVNLHTSVACFTLARWQKSQAIKSNMFTEGENVRVATGDEKTAACWEKTKVILLGISAEENDVGTVRDNLWKANIVFLFLKTGHRKVCCCPSFPYFILNKELLQRCSDNLDLDCVK